MKIYQETRREGERVSDIDWQYNFLDHYSNYCCSDDRKQEICDKATALLKKVEKRPRSYLVNVDGYWRELYSVGMYDGWPYWSPTPALCTSGPFGSEWHFFYDLKDAKGKPRKTKTH